jgi:ABC-type nitrate/sulfonate/bicarbonate transport system substrate-binding protein
MRTRLTIGAFSPSVLLRVARRTGALDEQDLVVDELAVASSPAQFRSLLAGSLDAALTSPDNVLAYRYSVHNPLGRTVDARIVAAVDHGLGLALYGRPGLTSPAALVGETIGVDVPTSGYALAMYAAAESVGLARDSYRLVALGSTPKRLAALLAGECAATMLNAGNELRAEQAGCTALVRVTDVCTPYLGTVLAVIGDAYLEPVTRLAAALRRAAVGIHSGVLDHVTTEEAEAALGLSAPLARRYVERLKSPVDGLVVDGVVRPTALRTALGLRRRYLPDGQIPGSPVPGGPVPDGQIPGDAGPVGGVGAGMDRIENALLPGSGLLATSATDPGSAG